MGGAIGTELDFAVGGMIGSLEGEQDVMGVGAAVGSFLGLRVGDFVGKAEGLLEVGPEVGFEVVVMLPFTQLNFT